MSLDAPLSQIHVLSQRIADRMESEAAALGVRVARLACGARLIDAGVEVPGSLEAARLYAEACLGGLGSVRLATVAIGDAVLAEAIATTDAPLVACLGSQYAGWKVTGKDFFAMGSGPARSLRGQEPLFDRWPLRSRAPRSVLLLECARLPGDDVAAAAAEACGLAPRDLTILAAPTASLAGAVQVAARSVETALHKLGELGFDLAALVAGLGSCPVAPGHPDGLVAIGRTNDAVLYGARVVLWVRAADAAIEAILPRVPSCASREHGRLFVDLFREHGDFYKIDPLLFSPARVTFVNLDSGRVHSAGRTDEAALCRSFGLPG